ncbi:MAG: tetratricopeptide repeat protein [Roseinatronobacter sp.]
MSAEAALLAGLEERLWRGALADPGAPEADLRDALAQGARYRAVEIALRRLWRSGLPGAMAAQQACATWPRSIDFAVMALDFAPVEQRPEALAHLERVVMRANRRRAALAQACLRIGRADLAQAALAQIDPASETALDDLQVRAALALEEGRFTDAAADCAALQAGGRDAAAEALTLRLAWRRGGARAAAEVFAGIGQPAGQTCREAFEIWLAEGDYARAPAALAQWQAVGGASDLARAATRLALERGAAEVARDMLQARLDVTRPWDWAAVDHVHWLRMLMLEARAPEGLRAHACAAARVHPRHDWLAHLARMAHEGVEDWRDLRPVADARPERAMSAARAALRMGVSGCAAGLLAPVRRDQPGATRPALLRVEGMWQAGRLSAAWAALGQVRAVSAPERAEAAFMAAELALMAGDPERAETALAEVAERFPDRMALWLTLARIAFQRGQFVEAVAAHAQFNVLKAQQIGPFVAGDVRDRITEDAAQAADGCAAAFDPALPVAETVAQAGLARVVAAPGLAACLLQRAQVQGALAFRPDPARAIPRRIAHYWQGPMGPAIPRALAQWRRLHPGFESLLFDAESAADWLGQNVGPAMQARFVALDQPALRADLFRLCWIAQEGGIFADLDEYPRIPITPWLPGAHAVFCIERGFGTVANNFLAAVPGHPICLHAQEMVLAALDASTEPYPWWHTGPAQWTRAAFAHVFAAQGAGVRFLSQAEYNRRVATNLPYPHKRRPDHWRWGFCRGKDQHDG